MKNFKNCEKLELCNYITRLLQKIIKNNIDGGLKIFLKACRL